MRVLLVGGGAREHALAWKLTQDDAALELLAAPGNPGIALHARCFPIAATDVPGLLDLARTHRPDLTVVGPEAPLAAGIVDRFRGAGFAIFGPTAAAAEIESSKVFAKHIMIEAGVPTAHAEPHSDPTRAKRAVHEFGIPVVIKASGLAAGKGAVVCQTLDDAEAAIDAMLSEHRLGPAGREILVEEFMPGEELSLFGITDGEHVLSMLPAQDHKRLLERDRGPNTGGMGAYAPVSVATDELVQDAIRRIFLPTLAALRDRGRSFSGLLYAGLMLGRGGLKVVEFNCRFGDPETEVLLPLLKSSLLEVLIAAVHGRLRGRRLDWHDAAAVTTVVAAAGYPDAPRHGDPIALPAGRPGLHIFHAGTARAPDGSLVTAGGRVLALTATAATLAEAQGASVAAAAGVDFAGKQFRADIGWRELQRIRAGAPRD